MQSFSQTFHFKTLYKSKTIVQHDTQEVQHQKVILENTTLTTTTRHNDVL